MLERGEEGYEMCGERVSQTLEGTEIAQDWTGQANCDQLLICDTVQVGRHQQVLPR